MIHGLARPDEGELIAYTNTGDPTLFVGFYDAVMDWVASYADGAVPDSFRDVQQWASIAAWWASDNRSRQVRFAPDEPDVERTAPDAPDTEAP